MNDNINPDETPSPHGSLHGTVLLIDDEAHLRVAVVDILSYENMEVITAAEGQKGIHLFRTHSEELCLVLLDLSMPDLGGEEVYGALRQIDADVPIVVSSGYSKSEVARRFAGIDWSAFMQKPYDMDTLLDIVRQHSRQV